MRYASSCFIYCILLLIISPIILHLYLNIPVQVKIYDITSKTIIKLPLEEYVWRVISKEMPASYSAEALKAQAVAARTYAYKKLDTNLPEHKGADVCNDFSHCMAFLTATDEETSKQNNVFIDATQTTKEQILTYDGAPILAVFHAISSGITENSSEVWQSQLPYLINVDSSLDENVKNFHTQVIFTSEEFKNKFPIVKDDNIVILEKTKAGSVKEIKIFGEVYTGSQVREKLGLRSSKFDITINDDKYYFDVYGYGHGVGMSQAGANEYAKQGATYKEILYKYYPGTKLTDYKNL